MERKRDFHRQVRVVYRAMRKLYGTEKVQDECLRVFKVLFPLQHKAATTGECVVDEKTKSRLKEIFDSWDIHTFSELDILTGRILSEIEKPMTSEKLIQFCKDCTPVVMRIRKLTPRECGRLMDVDDKDLDIMLNCGISKSALYKLFGNSICVGVLYNIFRKLFIETEQDIVKGEPIQLSLW